MFCQMLFKHLKKRLYPHTGTAAEVIYMQFFTSTLAHSMLLRARREQVLRVLSLSF